MLRRSWFAESSLTSAPKRSQWQTLLSTFAVKHPAGLCRLLFMFKGFKEYGVRPFSDKSLLEFVASSLKLEWDVVGNLTRPPQLSRIIRLLKKLGCKTIVAEFGFIDRDYRSEYAVYYARRFSETSPRCTRLHFFREAIGEVPLLEWLPQLEADHYLGFCVVRPTEFNRIGRTLIRAPDALAAPEQNTSRRAFVTCESVFKTHLLGQELAIKAMPFIQQDTQVGVCAHAALWMVARYMSASGYCPEFLPAEINQLAKARQPGGRALPAEQGLTTMQMLDALSGMGLSCIHYAKEHVGDIDTHIDHHFGGMQDVTTISETEQKARLRTWKLADIAYRYIESRLPVIFVTKDHALVGVGHTLQNGYGARLTIENIPSFLINDDARGLYLELPLRGTEGNADQVKEITSFAQVRDILAVTPPSARLCGANAEEGVRSSLRFLPNHLESRGDAELDVLAKELAELFKQVRLRTYLLRAAEFQQELRSEFRAGRMNEEVFTRLIRLDYPRYVWVTELCPIARAGEPPTCVGKVVVDSTAAKHDNMVIALLAGRFLFLSNRHDPDDVEELVIDPPCQLSVRPMGREVAFLDEAS